MDYLWTPWRSTYMQAKTGERVCIFCAAAENPAEDATSLVVYRGSACFVILNRYPYTSGHMMIVPYQHISRLTQSSVAASQEMMQLAREAELVLEDAYQPDGLNLGMNFGPAAGAGIAEHIHMHVLPRWSGDANFMTTVAETRIIPEALDTTYAKIQRGFRERLK